MTATLQTVPLLPSSVARSDKELLDEALAVAAKSDVIVAALGESSEMSGESSCRTNLEMTDTQRILLQELLKTGKPVVLVLFTGRPLVLNWEQANVPAILNVWFAGSEAGFAIGDVLFGDVNPSGKLTTTFPKSVGQIPLFYNHKNTGRPLADGAWFQKFRGYTVCHDTGSGSDKDLVVFLKHGTDCNTSVKIAGKINITNGSAINATLIVL